MLGRPNKASVAVITGRREYLFTKCRYQKMDGIRRSKRNKDCLESRSTEICKRRGKDKGKKRASDNHGSSDTGSDSDFVYKIKRTTMRRTRVEDSSSDYGGRKGARVYRLKKGLAIDIVGNGEKSRTCYRSNLRTSVKELNDLEYTAEHIAAINKTPFWLMFDAIFGYNTIRIMKRCSKNERDIKEIILCFDERLNKFLIGRKTVDLTKRDVQLIFGISGGAKDIPLKLSSYDVPPWVRRCFGDEIDREAGQVVLSKSIIYDALKREIPKTVGSSVLDVARLTHCYLLASVLAPNQNAAMSLHLTVYLEKFDEIVQYDWPKMIVEMLMGQVRTTKNLKCGGCTMLLPFWFLEHTNLVTPVSSVGFPRFLKWDLSDLNSLLGRVHVANLEKKFVCSKKLDATPREKDKFAELHRLWQDEHDKHEKTLSIDEWSHAVNTTYDSAENNGGGSSSEGGINHIVDLGDGADKRRKTNYCDNFGSTSRNQIVRAQSSHTPSEIREPDNLDQCNHTESPHNAIKKTNDELMRVVSEKDNEIDALKKKLHMREVEFQTRMNEEIEAYRQSRADIHMNELKEKDEMIRRLLVYKDELTELLNTNRKRKNQTENGQKTEFQQPDNVDR